MAVKVYNNAYMTLASPVLVGDLSITLTAGHGARCPLTAGDWTYGTFVKNDGSLEVVKITARATDVLTIVRAQDGTTALALAVGDRMELRPCAALMNDLIAQGIDNSRKAVLLGTDTYTGTLSPAITVLTQQLHLLQFPNANTSTSPTLNLNAIGAKPLKNRDGAALAVGDIKAGSWHIGYYDGTNFNLLTVSVSALTDDTTTNATHYMLLAASASANGYKISSTKFTCNPSTGDFTAAGNLTAYSDRRLKSELVQIENALDKVDRLTGYVYLRTDTDKRETGLIAQDVLTVLPEAVLDDGEYLSLAYGNLAGLLVEAIKALRGQIKAIEARLPQ